MSLWMLPANTTKPQLNSKILSIYDKSSSRGGVSSLSTSMSSNPSQRFSQSNLSRPLFSQSLLSAQDHPPFISPSIDSQKFPFSFPSNSQRSQPLSDPSQNPYGLPLSRPHPYQNYIPETIPGQQDFYPQYYRGPSSENLRQQFVQVNEEAVSQTTKLPHANEDSSQVELSNNDGKNEQELSKPSMYPEIGCQDPMDELGNQLMKNLEKLKNELKQEVERCADLQEARETVTKHFETFEGGLKQILETYEQFEIQLKRIEEVFMMQTQNVIQGFVENSSDLDTMEKKIDQRVSLNRRNLCDKIHKMYYEPIKQTIAKQHTHKNAQPRDVRIPGLYDKVMKPFPSYASAHCYETRNAVTIIDKKQYELEIIEDDPTMEIELQKEEATQLTKAVPEKKKQQQQKWRI